MDNQKKNLRRNQYFTTRHGRVEEKKTNETRLILFKLMNFSDIYLDIYLYV